MGRKIASLTAAGLACLAAPGIAFAATEFVDGGEWDHGSTGGRVWSNYQHFEVRHGSSVQGLYFDDSGCQAPGVPARASAPAIPGIADGAYYRHC